MAASLITGALGAPIAAAAELDLAKLSKPHPVHTSAVHKGRNVHPDQTADRAWDTKKDATWPQPGVTTLDVTDTPSAEAGSLPVRIRSASSQQRKQSAPAAERLQVQTLDQSVAKAVGVKGLILAVRPAGAGHKTADVRIDYKGFRNAYGGDWASRLTLRQLPACALTTPGKKGCEEGRALPTVNDPKSATLTTTLPLLQTATATTIPTAPVAGAASSSPSATGLAASAGTTVLAVAAAPSGSQGNFSATSLAPSASWSAGGSSGGFSWSYDIDTPDVPGDVQPDLALSYSSQSVDGRTAATNNQANSIGDGWSMEPGYVERRYVSCSDDTTGSNAPSKSGELCWKSDNAVLNLGGHSSVLVKDDATKQWHLDSDDGTKVEKLTSSNRHNGDNNGEYWKVTTPDGTRYYFGYNRLPGWSSGKPETHSTWTEPVYGNQAGEDCHASSFADSWCQQAWRWNLDYVVNPHGDAMAYYWTAETNYYGRNVNTTTGASTATIYDRGGYLDRIEYGLRSSSMYGQKAAAKVDFTMSERCLSDCGTFDKTHAKNWPDVPFDRYCAPNTDCKGQYSPSFWTRKRLTGISTSVLTGGVYKPVDSWALTHQFPATGDGSSPALWLASITRTGHTGTGDVTLPAVTFKGQTLPNRVEGATTGGDADPIPPLWRYRIWGINTESGGTIGITYSPQDCKAGDVPTPSSNTRRCYPVIWSPPDAPAANYEPYLDWFHSYVVTQVIETDNTGGAPAKETDYSYLDGLGWAKAKDDEFTKAKYLTYGDRKGYGRVQVRTGAGSDPVTLKEYRYFRGIDGAEVKDHEGVAVTDREQFSGMTREEATFDGDGGKLLSTTSYTPWRSAATATGSRPDNLPPLKAYATGTASEKTRTAVGSGWRTTQTDRTFDNHGQVLSSSDLGDASKTGDEECTTTTYAKNASENILNLVAEVKTVAKACGTTPSLPDDLVSDARHYYDGATSLTTAPTKGDETRLDEQDAKGTGYLTTGSYTYDLHGRQLTQTDALGHTTTTAYTPKTIEPPTSSTETNALGQTTTTTLDPTRGTTTATVDANGKRSDAVYDGLGRIVQAWQPGWSKADHPTAPTNQFAYKISRTEANAVTTKTLKRNGDYAISYQLYDGLMRQRETQTTATGTKDRIVTETLYDTRGFAWKNYAAYYTTGAPSDTLISACGSDSQPGECDNAVPSATETHFDGSGRPTAAIALNYGDEKWRTTTVYGGDRTTVIPPSGGTATTTVTDARGRTTELLQYTNADRSASQKTSYSYGKYDEPIAVTDPEGNVWKTTFDARGQKIATDDPDTGHSTTSYDDDGNAVSTTDARGTTLTVGYDKLGRKTRVSQGSTTLADWTYDTVAKGQLTSSTRYIDGAAYTTAIGSYTDRYQPASQTVTIPSAAGALAGTYTWRYGYNAATGLPDWTLDPAIGDIPSEHVTTGYNSDDMPIQLTHSGATIVNNTLYDVFDRPSRTEFGNLGKKVYDTQTYDEFTGRLTRQTTDRDLAPQRIDDTTYAYDPSGNITGITTASGQDQARTVDTQCFTTDPLGQLTQAWTAATDCSKAPTDDTVGGPDAYWESFGYDAIGNRTTLTDHHTSTDAGSDVTTTYTSPALKTGLPHAVQQASVEGGPHSGTVDTFQYDKAGNTTQRTIDGETQNLTWDPEGHLATVSTQGGTTSYLYGADGERMIAKNADGSQTLTLPEGNELNLSPTGAKTGTRYYDFNGETVAVRTGSTTSYLLSDHQGTALTAVAVTTLAITRRKQLPFGANRPTGADSFPGNQGFVGGTIDPTGLTHLGAREYDPVLGRFISPDPVIDYQQPAQMNAYAYARNSPVTSSDPDGLCPADLCGVGYPIGGTGTGPNNPTRFITKAPKHSNRWDLGPYINSSGKPFAPPRSVARAWHYMTNAAAKRAKDQASAAADRAARAAIAAKAAAEKQRRKTDGIFGNIMKGHFSDAWKQTKSGLHDTFGTWEGWKNRVIPGIGFAACAVASAGLCTGIGLVAVGATFIGDRVTTGEWHYAAAGKSLAWTLGGGLAARGLAGSWRGSAFLSRTRVKTVYQKQNVTIYGYRKTLDVGATQANISLNIANSGTFCGAGAASPGSAARWWCGN
ncbi:RHS repeat domain-containing protein [Streptomyces montanisoli]|uniref:RHS repeat domain-containing protein n=1 Tax=Streptomyces montanisoli TaxID=2798581 RepID=UPI0027DB6B88|nr:RHS repeat-associated core domain-containing protein [Streptomyces montanisoli]